MHSSTLAASNLLPHSSVLSANFTTEWYLGIHHSKAKTNILKVETENLLRTAKNRSIRFRYASES